MRVSDLAKTIECLIAQKDMDNAQPSNAIDRYICSRYIEIKHLLADIYKLDRADKTEEPEKQIKKAVQMINTLTEAVHYLGRYEKEFPKDIVSKLKEEGIPDAINDMLLLEVDENTPPEFENVALYL